MFLVGFLWCWAGGCCRDPIGAGIEVFVGFKRFHEGFLVRAFQEYLLGLRILESSLQIVNYKLKIQRIGRKGKNGSLQYTPYSSPCNLFYHSLLSEAWAAISLGPSFGFLPGRCTFHISTLNQ